MNILIVEDMPELKLRNYEGLLYQLKINYKVVGSKEKVISYLENSDDSQEFEKVDGIILDLDFPRFENGRGYYKKMGIELIDYLVKNNIYIPIMINSDINLEKHELNYPNIYGQCKSSYDPKYWENFFEYIYNNK